MVVVITFVTDVSVLADQEDAERLARAVIDEEVERTRAAIVARLVDLGVEVTMA
jgi:hypothetical protein